MKKYAKSKDLCLIVMPSGKYNILELNQDMKSDKMTFIIYADLKYLLYKKIDGGANNPENFSTTKIHEHISCLHLIK